MAVKVFLAFFQAILLSSTASELKQKHNSYYCELFQFPSFRGESLRIPEDNRIFNLSQVTSSWNNLTVDENGEIFYSLKLPSSLSFPESGTSCIIHGCTEEYFNGNCTTLRLSRKKIKGSRIQSFDCKCSAMESASIAAGAGLIKLSSKNGVRRRRNRNCGGVESFYNEFSNFTKVGKKIIGIGRNYVWHKNDLSKIVSETNITYPEIIFLKPTTSYLEEGQLIKLPDLGTIYYELELGVVIRKPGSKIEEKDALDYVAGYVLALDMTAKEFLKSATAKGLPWEIGKGFDGACPVGKFIPKSCIPDPHNIQLICSINGNITQNGNTKDMIFKIPQLISYISKYMTLEPNDVILTGTPDGFGPVKSGDVIEGSLNENLGRIKFIVE